MDPTLMREPIGPVEVITLVGMNPLGPADTVGQLLSRAAHDGHTVATVHMLHGWLAALGVADGDGAIRSAREQGIAQAAGLDSVALPAVARAEEQLAAAVRRKAARTDRLPAKVGELIAGAALIVFDAPVWAHTVVAERLAEQLTAAGVEAVRWSAGSSLDPVVTGQKRVLVVTEADQLSLERAAQLTAGECRLVLVGDSAMPPPPGPGRVFTDLLGAEAVVSDRFAIGADGEITALAAAVRAGSLPQVDSPTHEVVVVPVRSRAEAAARVRSLIEVSIPRSFEVGPADILVTSPLHNGPLGTDTMASRLGKVQVAAAEQAMSRRWPAAIVVLPAEAGGLLTRRLVYGLLTRATVHLSIIHGVGSALAAAVSAGVERPVRRRLPTLLTEGG